MSLKNVQVLLLCLHAYQVIGQMVVPDVCGASFAYPEDVVGNPIPCSRSEQKYHACPVTSYTFPSGAANDYLRFIKPIPKLNSGTVCSWIDLKDGKLVGTWFSYATNKYVESLSVFGNPGQVGRNATIDIQINNLGYYPKFYVEGKERIHLCMTFSVPDKFMKWYVDGCYFMETPIDATEPIEGDGILILGQEQDKLGGGFQPPQAYKGNIANFMMWTRPLAWAEIFEIVTECRCPKDYNVTLHHRNVYVSGAVSCKLLTECPKVKQ